jgi:hypothetical protein
MKKMARYLYLISIILILLASGCIQKNANEKSNYSSGNAHSASDNIVCPGGQASCNGTCYNTENETCCKGKLYTGVVVCCNEKVCQKGYGCCNGTCYDPKRVDCFNSKLTVPADLLPENVSEFRQIENKTAIKNIAGKEVQEASATFVPTGGRFNYVKAVLVRIMRYPYEGDIAAFFNGSNTTSENALDEKKKEIQNEISNESSAYYSNEESKVNELPSDIRFMIQNGQVNRMASASGTPLSSESSSYNFNYTQGKAQGYIRMNIYYVRISTFLHGDAEETKKEVENTTGLFDEAIREKMRIT